MDVYLDLITASKMGYNSAAWIKTPKEQFIVEEAPYTSPGDKEIVVRAAAVAINPLVRFGAVELSNLTGTDFKRLGI